MTKNYFWLVAVLSIAFFASGAAAQVSSGTTFAVAPELLITNEHVIAGCNSVVVISADKRLTGSVLKADRHVDLALLRVNGIKGTTARLRNPRNIRLGESVLVFGFPLTGSLSSSGNFTSGLVSALRGFKDKSGELQITAPVQPGNSGAPLMDASGLVIGVVQAKLDAIRAAMATGDIPQNVNFAIALDVLANFLTKNKVSFRDGAMSAPLETVHVAELAQSFTYRIECRGRSQQAGANKSPDHNAQEPPKRAPVPSTATRRVNPSESELAKASRDIIDKIAETRAGAEKLIALHESERQRRAAELKARRDLHSQGLISSNEVTQAENDLIEATRRVEEDRRWLAETDAAVKEAETTLAH